MTVDQAEEAVKLGGSPVSAILVRGGSPVSYSYSRRDVVKGQKTQDRIHHAEFNLLVSSSLPLEELTLYTTLEPCLMCMGIAMVGRVRRVAWALNDFWGGAMSLYRLDNEYIRSHLPEVVSAPFLDLQKRAAALWVEYLKKTNYEEYIQRVLGDQA